MPFRLLFGFTLLASAGLLFFVQPMFAKMVLPRLGGSPGVWNACIAFYQAVLLAGYAYAHWLTTRFSLPAQVALHGIVLAVAVLALPVGIPASWIPPDTGSPVTWLLQALGSGVGGPLLVISASSPLLQRWFSRMARPSAADPYFLYGTSNLGSLAALLAYPLLVEPSWTLTSQSRMWSVGFIAVALLVTACGVVAWRASGHVLQRPTGSRQTNGLGLPQQVAATDGPGVSWRQRMRWLVLAAVPSSLLLSVTTYLSTDVAAIPLLWTLPLACYLSSFVVTFAPRSLASVDMLARLARMAPLAICAVILLLFRSLTDALSVVVPTHLFALFAVAVALHLQLVRDRPAPRHLTEFYVWMSLGGVAGGCFNAFVAPAVFTGVAEYPIGLVAASFLLSQPGTDRDGVRLTDVAWAALLGVGAIASAWLLAQLRADSWTIALLVAPLVLVCASFRKRRLRFALAVAVLLLVGDLTRSRDRELFAERSFFGVHRVTIDSAGRLHRLTHGTTLHGQQSLDVLRGREPLTYYHQVSPIAQAVAMVTSRQPRARVAAVGLGAGTLAAYARDQQRWTFYEIDAAVARIAGNPQFFTYLSDCGDRCLVCCVYKN